MKKSAIFGISIFFATLFIICISIMVGRQNGTIKEITDKDMNSVWFWSITSGLFCFLTSIMRETWLNYHKRNRSVGDDLDEHEEKLSA